MKIRLLITAILLLSISLSALTLDEAKAIALKNNPDLLAQQESTKAGKNSLWQAYLNVAPSAMISGGYTKYDDEMNLMSDPQNPVTYDSKNSYSLIVNQPIFNGGKLWFGTSVSNKIYEISKESLKITKLNTLANVETKYFSVLENKALLEIARQNLKSTTTNKEISKIRYEAGTLSKADYLQLQSEQANKEVNLIQMEMLYKVSLLDLANFLQLETIDELEVINKVNYQAELISLQTKQEEEIKAMLTEVLGIGLENNPSLKISKISIENNKKTLLMAGGNFLPTLNLQYSKNWSKYDFEDEFNSSIGQIGLNISMPIFPLVDNGLEVTKANHTLKKSKYEYESAKSSIHLAIEHSLLNMIAAAKIINSSELALQYAEETYNQMKERFANGIITANELLSIEIMFTSAQNQYTSSFYNYLKAKSSLLLLVGTEDSLTIIK